MCECDTNEESVSAFFLICLMIFSNAVKRFSGILSKRSMYLTGRDISVL